MLCSFKGPGFSSENMSHAASLGVPYASALNSFSNDVNMERLKSSNGAATVDAIQSFNRKRALSSSPYPDLLDVSTMIRHSPNSLYGSKTSHMSGSFGHLAAMTALNNTTASAAVNNSIGSHMSISSLPTSLQHFLMSGDILPSLSGHYISPSNSMFSLAHHQAMMQVDASMQSLKSVNINLFNIFITFDDFVMSSTTTTNYLAFYNIEVLNNTATISFFIIIHRNHMNSNSSSYNNNKMQQIMPPPPLLPLRSTTMHHHLQQTIRRMEIIRNRSRPQ